MINALKIGIYNKVISAGSFNTAIGGRAYYEVAPQGVIFPYCTYHFITETESIDSSTTYKNPVIQFNIYSNTSGSTEVGNLETYLKALFDYASLTVTGYSNILTKPFTVNRLPKIDDQTVWQTVVSYLIFLEKN